MSFTDLAAAVLAAGIAAAAAGAGVARAVWISRPSGSLQYYQPAALSTRQETPGQVHAGEEDHARPGRTTSRRGQDSPWKSQPE